MQGVVGKQMGDAAGVLRGFGGLLEQEMLGMGLHEGA